MDTAQELDDKLKRIKKVFDIEKVLFLKTNNAYIQRYYKINRLAYCLFHSSSGRMHIGLSKNSIYKESDTLAPERTIEKYINKTHARYVLELGTGTGATASYLAEKFPQVTITGIDVSPTQITAAAKKAKRSTNYHPVLGDYHNLQSFPKNYFDVVFAIETLCYSHQKEKVLQESYRVLKKGGVFINFEGYDQKEASKLTENEKIAKKLAEKGVAMAASENYKDFLAKVKSAGFTLLVKKDASKESLPTLKRFEKQAMKFFSLPTFIAKGIVKLFPPEFTYNVLTGFLLTTLIESRVYSYNITIVRKNI